MKVSNSWDKLTSKKERITRGVSILKELSGQVAEEKLKGTQNIDKVNGIVFEYVQLKESLYSGVNRLLTLRC